MIKKIYLVSFLSLLLFSACSNNQDKKEVSAENTSKTTATLSDTISESTKVSFVAFKTTQKVPVGGYFEKIKLKNVGTKESPESLFVGSEFSIPVKTLKTGIDSRNTKILTYFFKTLVNTDNITGKINSMKDGVANINITINGITKPVLLSYTSINKSVTFEGKIDVVNFDAMESINMLNEECYELHKGADGESKLWSEVSIKIESVY